MVGTFIGFLITAVLNPFVLQPLGIIHQWAPNDDMQTTVIKNNIDFYFSFSIGVSLAIAVVGFIAVFRGVRQLRQKKLEHEQAGGGGRRLGEVPEGRGDIRPLMIIGVYLLSTLAYILLSGWLIDWHRGVMIVMFFYGFIYTPVISYVTARMEGIAGEVVNIPFVREASFILCGYQGVDVWFLPIPMQNYGSMAVFYRQAELTGTRFWSIWKAEILLTPIVLIATLLFAHFIWGLADIPGPMYPYVQEWWEVNAENAAIIHSSTLGGFSRFDQALRMAYIWSGLGIGLVMFAVMRVAGAPIFFTYGVVRGLNMTVPFGILPQFIGALIGRFYFQRRLGLAWRQYIPVIVAGYFCGFGLVGTLGIGFTFLVKSVFTLPF